MIKLADYCDKYPNFDLKRSSEGILTLRLHTNHEPVVWGLDPIDQLGHLWGDIASDRENKVVVVTGTADEFIGQVAVSVEMSGMTWDYISQILKRMYRNHLSIEVPMIAAVNGAALVHSEQALLCDIVLASDNARFQDSTHFLQGLPPGDGVQLIYNWLLGPNRARYFLYMGEEIDAGRARDLGMVSEVTTSANLLDRAHEIARAMIAQPEIVRRTTRQVTVEPLRRLYAGFLNHGIALEGLGAWGAWALDD